MRLYLMVLPLVAVVVLVSGVLASFESRAALTRVANRHMAYKAEQLRDFVYSEWGVLEELDLTEQPEFRQAFQDSLRSYALSLLRNPSEMIVAIGPAGEIAMHVGLQLPPVEESGSNGPMVPPDLPIGWFNALLFGEERVGVAFEFEAFEWTIAITELQSVFFSDIHAIRYTSTWILAIALSVTTILLTIYVRYIVRPAERLTDTIEYITDTNDLSRRASVEYADEIGLLAYQFNTMISALQDNYRKLESANRSEKRALETAVQREKETLYILSRVSDFRDEDTGQHLRRIGELSALFSRLLGQSERQQDLIRRSAPLHDIGKIGIPDSILLKPAKLTTEEFEQIKEHALIGYELLKGARSEYLEQGAMIALTHHENWDGSGYPKGLNGKNIPLPGRIVSIVDVFDALISERPYKKAYSTEKALELICEGREKKFDPVLIDLFAEHFARFCKIVEIKPETG